jgi:osmotically inducible protein OsmC
MKRTATAIWNGSGKTGNGTLSSQSGVLKQTQYSYNSRFEEGIGTNPEELIAAAHAGCFSMKLSFVLGAANLTPESIQTTASVSLENGVINEIHLDCLVKVPGMDATKFQEYATDAKENCPVSKVLAAAKITLTAKCE